MRVKKGKKIFSNGICHGLALKPGRPELSHCPKHFCSFLRQNASQCVSPPSWINEDHKIVNLTTWQNAGVNLRWTSNPFMGSSDTLGCFIQRIPKINASYDEPLWIAQVRSRSHHCGTSGTTFHWNERLKSTVAVKLGRWIFSKNGNLM